MSQKLWGARFKEDLHPAAKCFSYSLATDYALLSSDVKVSMAHVSMLGKVGLISKQDTKKMIRGLWQILAILKRKDISALMLEVEDIHTLIQETLEKKIGKLAKKLHTARSRNDLVATSTRLYVINKSKALALRITQLQSALLRQAEKNEKVLVPGYTHLQHAQIVLLAHHLLAYVEMFRRDFERVISIRERLSECPLGSGALAGSGLPIDRAYVAKLLGFKRPSANSMDAVSDRDFVIETISHLAILMMHASRLSEDLILWNSSEFRFVTLSDQYSTGSSLMPHKKNPDMLELIKGRTGEAYGHLMSVLTTMKGLPLTYNRDMQADKKPLFEALDLAELTLEVLTGVIGTMDVNKEACQQALQDSFLYATDLLEYLVGQKVAFRDAHDAVGRLVQYALDSHTHLSGLKLVDFQKFSPKFKKDVLDIFEPQASVARKVSSGSTNPKMVKASITKWKKQIKQTSAKLRKSRQFHA